MKKQEVLALMNQNSPDFQIRFSEESEEFHDSVVEDPLPFGGTLIYHHGKLCEVTIPKTNIYCPSCQDGTDHAHRITMMWNVEKGELQLHFTKKRYKSPLVYNRRNFEVFVINGSIISLKIRNIHVELLGNHVSV